MYVFTLYPCLLFKHSENILAKKGLCISRFLSFPVSKCCLFFGLFEEEGTMIFRKVVNYLPVHMTYHPLFVLWHCIPTQSEAILLLRFLDQTHTQTHTRTKPLATRTDLYQHNTKQTQQTNIHTLIGIRIRDPSNQAAADHCL